MGESINSTDEGLKTAEQEIAKSFPELAGMEVKYIGRGMWSTAYTIGDNWIFRFANSKKADKDYRKEIRILGKLKPYLDLEIPEIKLIGTQESNGFLFAGHKVIKGKEKVEFSEENKEQIRCFVQQLHAIPVEIAAEAGIRESNPKNWYESILSDARVLAFPRIIQHFGEESGRKIINKIEELFQGYLENPENFEYQKAIIHGDVSPDHFLIDEKTGKINGVIDWGNISIADPDCDLWRMCEYYPDIFSFNEKQRTKISFFSKAQRVWRANYHIEHKTSEEERVIRDLTKILDE